MQDLELTFTYLSGLAIWDREVFWENLSSLTWEVCLSINSPLSTVFLRQTIFPTEGVERRERKVGRLGLLQSAARVSLA